jgi:hypothetical protein
MNIKSMHKKAARLYLLGWRNKEIAREVGKKSGTVSDWKDNPDFQALVAELEIDLFGSLERRIRAAKLKAVRKLEKMVNSGNSQNMRWAVDAIIALQKPSPLTVKHLHEGEVTMSGTVTHDGQIKLKKKAKKHLMSFLDATRGTNMVNSN